VGDRLVVVSFGSNEVRSIGREPAPLDEKVMATIPTGGLDGIVVLGDGATLLVSSWKGKAVYRGTLGGTFVPVLEGLEAPADIAYDKNRARVLVPRFMGYAVEAYALK